MKTLVLIHTTRSTLNHHEEQIHEAIPGQLKIYNIYDSWFAEVDNSLSQEEKAARRLERLRVCIQLAELCRPDLIVVDCSTISMETDLLKAECKTPLIGVDDAMIRYCAARADSAVVLATSSNPVYPVVTRLEQAAAQIGRTLDLKVALCEEALPYLFSLDMERYTEIVLDCARQLRGSEMVILAQGSTAVIQKEIEDACQCPVISSPVFLIEEIRQVLNL